MIQLMPFLCCQLSKFVFTDTSEPLPDGELRLVDKVNPTGGRLEILKNGLWGTICSYHFNYRDADVACRQLGYTSARQIWRKLVILLVVVCIVL